MLTVKTQEIIASGYHIYGFEPSGNHIISHHFQPKKFKGEKLLWILPEQDGGDNSIFVKCGKYEYIRKNDTATVTFDGGFEITKYGARPPCDFFGNFIKLNIENGADFEKAYARFYWDNLLPQIAERTFMRKKKRIREGYVLSTLNKNFYGGTYPAVDHEFHFKGRFAVGGEAEKTLIKRMLELQLKIMRGDKKGLSRNVCSVQPCGRREYNVHRFSKDFGVKAQMFRLTANIEFIEALFLYYSMTKDLNFLSGNIEAAEKNCGYIESFINGNGLLDSHVYYEDQVIKNGFVTQAQCFAYNSMNKMSAIETLLGRNEKSAHYRKIAKLLGDSAVREIPLGYWDKENNRFIDWIDAKGQTHDHIHLLANRLPALFGLASKEQEEKCNALIKEHDAVFSKFPSFVAAKIEDYTLSEIGTGGPYDLCAAGRYWCWDAAYKAFKKDGASLYNQLLQVSEQAKTDNYFLGERYDMNYIYYISDKNWHGSALYYEYPNVFIYVLMSKYIGIEYGFLCDLNITPLIRGTGKIISENHGIEYSVSGNTFGLINLKDSDIKINLDLTGIGFDYKREITLKAKESIKIEKQ